MFQSPIVNILMYRFCQHFSITQIVSGGDPLQRCTTPILRLPSPWSQKNTSLEVRRMKAAKLHYEFNLAIIVGKLSCFSVILVCRVDI